MPPFINSRPKSVTRISVFWTQAKRLYLNFNLSFEYRMYANRIRIRILKSKFEVRKFELRFTSLLCYIKFIYINFFLFTMNNIQSTDTVNKASTLHVPICAHPEWRHRVIVGEARKRNFPALCARQQCPLTF